MGGVSAHAWTRAPAAVHPDPAGALWLKTTLLHAAWAAVRTKQTYLRAQFPRVQNRRRPTKAILAVAASMLTASYHIFKHRASTTTSEPITLSTCSSEVSPCATASRPL